jgi:prepilin-type processing-associated H-X9-DG protein
MQQDGVMYLNSSVRFSDISDGTSSTLLLGERNRLDPVLDAIPAYAATGPNYLEQLSGWAWTSNQPGAYYLGGALSQLNYQVPQGTTSDPTGTYLTLRLNSYGSNHTQGANFCFADGSVRILNQEVPVTILAALSTRANNELIDSSQY